MAEITYGEHEIPISKLLNVIHYPEWILIRVVTDAKGIEDNICMQYLTKDAYATKEETERLLKYYGDAPVWGLQITPLEIYEHTTYRRITTFGICANVYYQDIREGYLREKDDKLQTLLPKEQNDD